MSKQSISNTISDMAERYEQTGEFGADELFGVLQDILDLEPVATTATETTALVLTAEQASWLKGLMQNPIHTQYAAEDKTGRHMRKAIFKLL